MSAHPSTRLRKSDPPAGGGLVLVANGRVPGPTPDERLMLELVSLGLTDRQIGAELELSTGTVRAYLRRAVEALGARNRTHAVAVALKTGLIR